MIIALLHITPDRDLFQFPATGSTRLPGFTPGQLHNNIANFTVALQDKNAEAPAALQPGWL